MIRSRLFDLLLAVWTGLFGLAIPILTLLRARDHTIRMATRYWARGVLFGLKHIVGLDHIEHGREVRQYVAADRTVTLHALGVLADLALAASRQAMADACVRQMHRLATSAKELLKESVAHDEIEAELKRALQAIASRGSSM